MPANTFFIGIGIEVKNNDNCDCDTDPDSDSDLMKRRTRPLEANSKPDGLFKNVQTPSCPALREMTNDARNAEDVRFSTAC